MYTNRKGCTIYEKTVQNRSPTYIRHETGEIYWEETTAQKDGSDRSPQNEAFVSIPAASIDYEPKSGDRIVGSIIADLQPPANAMTIMSAENFCYGSPAVQHWELNAK